MATSVGLNHRKSKTTSKNNDDVIAAAVQAELSHVAAFEGWLLERIEADGDGAGVLARVQEHLLQYKLGLLESTLDSKQDEHLKDWSMHVSVHDNGSNGQAIIVTVPGSLKPIEIVPKDDEEAAYLLSDKYLGFMVKACRSFAHSQASLRSLFQLAKEIDQETSHLRQTPEVTIQTYIRHLKEYNDMKDIAQQLIGLVAENRGVPVGSLYRNREFGVTEVD